MKKIAKLLIPIIAVACVACNDTPTKNKDKVVETRDDIYFYEPGLYKNYLDRELKALYIVEKPDQPHYKSGGEENTVKDCVSPIDPDCDNKKWMETAGLTSKGLKSPPKPNPCPQGNCIPWGIILKDIYTKCEVKIFDADSGKEIGRSVGNLTKISAKGYVAMELSLNKVIDGNLMMQISRFNTKGVESTYTVKMNPRNLSSMNH